MCPPALSSAHNNIKMKRKRGLLGKKSKALHIRLISFWCIGLFFIKKKIKKKAALFPFNDLMIFKILLC